MKKILEIGLLGYPFSFTVSGSGVGAADAGSRAGSGASAGDSAFVLSRGSLTL